MLPHNPPTRPFQMSEWIQEKRRDLSLLNSFKVSPNTATEMNKKIATPRRYVIAMWRGEGRMQKHIQVGVTYSLSFCLVKLAISETRIKRGTPSWQAVCLACGGKDTNFSLNSQIKRDFSATRFSEGSNGMQ